jgi:glucoamylase
VQGRYCIEKQIIADPLRDVVLQRTRFVPLQGALADYHLYVILAPHLGNRGFGNSGWVGDYKGVPMLFAEREGQAALALGCSAPWLQRSAGFVGASDGWQDLSAHRRMTWSYTRAENGNVALTGEIDLQADDGAFLLAIGFDSHALSAGHHVRASLLNGFDAALDQYNQDWQQWQSTLLSLEGAGAPHPHSVATDVPDERRTANDKQADRSSSVLGHSSAVDLYRTSAAVLHTHEAKQFAGGLIASLSIPWGFAKGDDDLGGYHLVWTRDLVETVGGLVAAGARAAARRVLRYLQVTQEADGHWPQNMWLDGTPYWSGVQLDETGFPILLAAQAWREGTIDTDELGQLWLMIRQAAGYIVRNGPVTQQDRWEEDAGYSPFTLAVEISALLAAAELAELAGEPEMATYLRETADVWNANIERWTYVTGTDLARQFNVDGYYVRIAPPDTSDAASPKQGFVPIKNRPPGQSAAPAEQIVSPDALALVRFGLRAPGDSRIVNTIKVVDALLKVETPYGPIWHRYNQDGYGEHADGAPFDGTGIGRAWPLLVGERAHYELAAGCEDEARRLMRAMEAFANEGGMLPEQVWDAPDIPERELCFGRPSGSAMPLVWAHAEYIKLRRSLREKRVFDLPPQTVRRYLAERTESSHAAWRFNHKLRSMPSGKTLRLEVLAPARVHWSADGWQTTQDADTYDTGLGVHVADLPTEQLQVGAQVIFTFYWPMADRWESVDYAVAVDSA